MLLDSLLLSHHTIIILWTTCGVNARVTLWLPYYAQCMPVSVCADTGTHWDCIFSLRSKQKPAHPTGLSSLTAVAPNQVYCQVTHMKYFYSRNLVHCSTYSVIFLASSAPAVEELAEKTRYPLFETFIFVKPYDSFGAWETRDLWPPKRLMGMFLRSQRDVWLTLPPEPCVKLLASYWGAVSTLKSNLRVVQTSTVHLYVKKKKLNSRKLCDAALPIN